jgi:16S rRNA (uracil1498-N3)-methyltransferase
VSAPPGRLEPFFVLDEFDVLRGGPLVVQHLRARRLRVGDAVSVGDGTGRVVRATIAELDREEVRFSQAGEVVIVPPRSYPVRVASFLPSRERLGWLVAKLAELGVDVFQPLVGPQDRRGGAAPSPSELDRLARVAREAAQQAEQPWVLRIEKPRELSAVVKDDWAIADPEGGELPARVRTVVIGPESGRLELVGAYPRVRLPGGILRVETAAVVAGALLVAFRDGIFDTER